MPDKEDLDDLANIYTAVYQAFDVGERWSFDSSHQLMAYWLKRQPDLFYVAEVEENVVGGFVGGIKPWWDGNHLVDGEVFVHPDYQKRGIATELSKKVYRTAIEKYDVTRTDGTTFSDRKFPLEWHLKHGFQRVANWTIISGDIRKILNSLKRR